MLVGISTFAVVTAKVAEWLVPRARRSIATHTQRPERAAARRARHGDAVAPGSSAAPLAIEKARLTRRLHEIDAPPGRDRPPSSASLIGSPSAPLTDVGLTPACRRPALGDHRLQPPTHQRHRPSASSTLPQHPGQPTDPEQIEPPEVSPVRRPVHIRRKGMLPAGPGRDRSLGSRLSSMAHHGSPFCRTSRLASAPHRSIRRLTPDVRADLCDQVSRCTLPPPTGRWLRPPRGGRGSGRNGAGNPGGRARVRCRRFGVWRR